MKWRGSLTFFLPLLFVAAGCSTMKSVFTGNRYADLPPRSAWIRKTGRWLTESRRLALYETSPQMDRMKKMMKRFNIQTLYLFVGKTPSSYAGFRQQGLYSLCKQLKADGFTVWASFSQEDWHERASEFAEVKQLTQLIQRDNPKFGNCFQGLQLELSATSLSIAQTKAVRDYFKGGTLPVILHAQPQAVEGLVDLVQEIVIVDNNAHGRKLASESRKPDSISKERRNLNLSTESMGALDLNGVEKELENVEAGIANGPGAAIFTLEHLMKKYDREEPAMPMMR